MSETATKFDTGKPRWDLMPWESLAPVVQVLMHGAEKYGENNWRQQGLSEGRLFAAAMRHLLAWKLGEETDSESGLPHLGHAVCNLLFLTVYEQEDRIVSSKSYGCSNLTEEQKREAVSLRRV